MKRTAKSLSVAALFCALVLPLRADSGTRVTSGALMYGDQQGVLDVAGQSDFRMRSTVFGANGKFDLMEECSDFCDPGTTISLLALWSGPDVNYGTVTFKGHSYALGHEGPGGALAIVRFDGSLTLPPLNDAGVVDVDAPFTFSGQVEFEDTGTIEPLSGSGIATVQFRLSTQGPYWVYTNATYALQH